MNPKVSIIIPIRNSEKTLYSCLASVLQQSYENYEIILIDNNSNDSSKKIINYFLTKNEKINYYFQPKIGRSFARNIGISKSTGDIIVMLDSDCIAHQNWLKNIIKPIINHGQVAVMGGEYDLIKNYWSQNIQRSNNLFNKKNTSDKYIKNLDTKNFAIKSSVMKKFMFDDNLKNFEDLDLYLRLSKLYKIYFLSKNKVGHCHKNSFLNTIYLNINRGYWTMKIYKKHKKNLKKLNHNMFAAISFINFSKLPLWLIFILFKNPKNFPFILTSELSWRIGLLGGTIK